jgi:hypothetical protein
VECPPGDQSCVGFQRISERFPGYTPVNPRYEELAKHPIAFPWVIATISKVIGETPDRRETLAISITVFISWLGGVVTYLCGLRAGLGERSSIAAVLLLFFASPWLVYSRELFPATFLGLLLIAALLSLLSDWFAISATLLAIASMQSESFVLVLPVWAVWLFRMG